MTDIETLRARMRELAKAVVAASEAFDGSKEAEASLDAANAEFDLACTADRIIALDAYTTRLREDLDRVTRERDDAIREVARLVKAREDAHGQWRSLAAERAVETSALKASLAKRDEEVARMRETMRAASVYLRKLEDNMLANDADMMLDDCLPPSFHADQIDATLTKEPTNAE